MSVKAAILSLYLTLAAAIGQLLEWTLAGIQDYCYSISEDALQELKELGCTIENPAYRANHLFGIKEFQKTIWNSLGH